ncbi:MAG TPA: metallophosphoesterase [Bryobacteraceae bacterium]|nr:metallophosphoesterase [Bryobacteraceae bacterium]HPQ14389.1 metallophosphoesterase [Bryobacteraceae bacterium]HPU74271.1 metallophosphoesterase [Bryobacteraceae bacterium]
MKSTRLGRRAFLQIWSTALAGASAARTALAGQAAGGGTVLYTGRFVPEGWESKIVFVSDHHYWPGHLENWGGGAQITTSTDRRMPDLAEVLNEERPDLSVHGGDVISAGGSFFPPPDEYNRQLAFAKAFYGRLTHPFMPLLGNHETLEASYTDEAQLGAWTRHFGAPYRRHDLKGWRIVGVNCLLPNPNGRYGRGNVFGLGRVQMDWLRASLKEASSRGLKVIICTHVPPANWVDRAEFEEAIASAGCVKAVICGHRHINSAETMGGVPVLVRTANVIAPFSYHVMYLYPDGRVLIIQKSQHFPFEDFISARMQQRSPMGSEADRYLTLGGPSQLPLEQLKIIGSDAEAAVLDGHLRLSSKSGRALALIDVSAVQNARLTLTAVKSPGEYMGAVALAGPDGAGGIEATLTARYSPDGKVFLVRNRPEARQVLARSWFNIADDVAYRLTLEVRNGRIFASWKNMLNLEAPLQSAQPGHFGFFVDRGTLFVTDVKLERLAG